MNEKESIELQAHQPENESKRDSTLRDERLQQLMESCQEEVLRQIIGPFGLTPAMFDDKDGGNVTTQHNAEHSIFAKKSEEYDRNDYSYSKSKTEIKEAMVKNGKMNSQVFQDQYTEKWEQSKRKTKNGTDAANFELDHVISLSELHKNGQWMKTKEDREKISSTKENLRYTTYQNNRGVNGKSDKRPEDFLTNENGFDEEKTKPIILEARKAIEKQQPTTIDRLKYHGAEIAKEGAKDASKNAMRQALGVLLHEFANGSFVEIKTLLKGRCTDENLIDRLVSSLKRVMDRVIKKLKVALDAAFQGGLQGFISNLLTFLINNLITTSKKIVTIIRESMQSLWRAIKLMVNPPEGMSAMEITNNVTKIIAAVVTTGLGLMMEESVKGFLMTIPMLAPITDVLATALTAIMTGIAGALIVYGIDRMFDWLNSKETELLSIQGENLDAQVLVVERLQSWMGLQYENSLLYEACSTDYRLMREKFAVIEFKMGVATVSAGESIWARSSMIEMVEVQVDLKKRLEDAFKSL